MTKEARRGEVCECRAIVVAIDEGALAPSYHAAVRSILAHLALGAEDHALLAEIDERRISDAQWWLKRVSTRMNTGDRVAWFFWVLLRPDEPIDWFAAEMVIDVARQGGVAEADICAAFGFAESRSGTAQQP